MEKASIPGKMEGSTKVITRMIESMGMVSTLGLMAVSMLGNGETGNSMVKGLIGNQMDKKRGESGKMERGSSGLNENKINSLLN